MKPHHRLLAFFAVLALVACTKSYLHAEVAHAEEVVVQPENVWIDRHKLWVRVEVINQGDEHLVVNRDAIVARLPSGQVVNRAMGRTSIHATYVIPPNTSHAVYVEFAEDGFDWDRVPSVTIDFTNAILRGNHQIPVQMPVSL
jgi:hypothetical protein